MTDDDQSALAWAASTEHPVAVAAVIRVRSGADAGLSAAELAVMQQVLTDLHDRARRGERVEVGCLGGHGRTGTALACLAVLTGTPAADALAWVRTNYCYKAVETEVQEALVSTFAS